MIEATKIMIGLSLLIIGAGLVHHFFLRGYLTMKYLFKYRPVLREETKPLHFPFDWHS